MSLEDGMNRLYIVSGIGIVLGGAYAKKKNKSILLGAGVGLALSIGLLFLYSDIQQKNLDSKRNPYL
jgi:hypothetical protein